jgi:hypothetical protein
LVAYGALKKPCKTVEEMVHPSNVDKTKLKAYAKECATHWGLPKDATFITDDRQSAQLFDFSATSSPASKRELLATPGKQRLP